MEGEDLPLEAIETFTDRVSRRVYDGSWTEFAQRVQPSENLIVKEGEGAGK